MKRQQLFLIVSGVLVGGVCLTAGWFLFAAMRARGEAAAARNEAYDELKRIYNAKVFPNEENIARVAEDRKALEAWLATASNLVHQGDLKVDDSSPAGFKDSLQAKVRVLADHPGAVKGKIVEGGFKFGFDLYLGDQRLPKPEHVERLTQQLSIIEQVCKELYAANILALESVERETFDDVKEEEPQDERRPRRRDRQPGRAASAPAPTAESEFFSKQRFAFTFQARPAACMEVLNRMTAMDLFVVVALTEFRKTDDPLLKRDARRKEKEQTDAFGAPAAPVDLAKVPHVDRIVTDPELEPPLSMKLVIDVYSFEGV